MYITIAGIPCIGSAFDSSFLSVDDCLYLRIYTVQEILCCKLRLPAERPRVASPCAGVGAPVITEPLQENRPEHSRSSRFIM